MRKLLILAFVIAAVTGTRESLAIIIPQDDTKAEYLYVTGPKGDPLTGAEDHIQVLHIDIPAYEQDLVEIAVFDPDTGGDIDSRANGNNPWDTVTVFEVYGRKGIIYKEKFGEGEYNGKFYYFGPLSKTDGVKIEDFYRFTLNITGITGDDTNLFNVKIFPDSAKVSSPNITLRLLPEEGAEMYFYPLIPEGISNIIFENYDMDEGGGHSILRDPETNEVYNINDSSSGQWTKTPITLSSGRKRYLDYIITKGVQPEPHMGIRVSHTDGTPIPIYFRKKLRSVPSPVMKPVPKHVSNECNEFTFDATESFDPDNQALTYSWEFGDGTTSGEPVVTHRFESGGDYNVILSVQDTSGLVCDTAVSSRIVHVNTPPDADFTAPQKACTRQKVIFDAGGTTDNTPGKLTYQWFFTDGTSAEGRQITKVFDKGGTYNVQLLVNDNSGTACSTDSLEKTITINTGPVANAGDDIDLCLQYDQEYRIDLDGSGSVDTDGDMLTYRWDFGDGNEATGANVTHVYQGKGEYVATLFVEDGSGSACSTASDTVNVRINKAPVAVAGDDITVCNGTEAVFDGSGSIGEGGEDLEYQWDFGDGTKGSGARVAHTYQNGGVYKAVLTVNDLHDTQCSSGSDSVLVTVNTMPSAVFTSVKTGCAGDMVSFDATNTSDPDGDALSYTWDFGDGTEIKGGSSATHVYSKGGNYSVRLVVDDNKGTVCSADTADISIRINTPPVADAGPNFVCCLDEESVFDASSSYDEDGDNLSYVWDFGDGSTGKGAKVTHVYSRIGKYIVTLTVNDNSGTMCNTDTDSFTAVVNAKPTSIIKIR